MSCSPCLQWTVTRMHTEMPIRYTPCCNLYPLTSARIPGRGNGTRVPIAGSQVARHPACPHYCVDFGTLVFPWRDHEQQGTLLHPAFTAVWIHVTPPGRRNGARVPIAGAQVVRLPVSVGYLKGRFLGCARCVPPDHRSLNPDHFLARIAAMVQQIALAAFADGAVSQRSYAKVMS